VEYIERFDQYSTKNLKSRGGLLPLIVEIDPEVLVKEERRPEATPVVVLPQSSSSGGL
jgi:hypothetical protein